MKKSTLLSVFLLVVFVVGCSQIDYNHPLDSAITYEHPEFFTNEDGDTIADYWDTSSNIYKQNLDITPPVLALTGPNPALIPYNDPNHVIPGLKTAYTVSDNRDPQPTVDVSNTEFSVIFPDTNEIIYTARDKAGNSTKLTRTVIVLPQAFVDTIKPQISVPIKDIEIYQNEQFDPMKNVLAYDETDGELKNITVTGEVKTAIPGVYTLTYKVKDSAGNEGTLERKITVIKSTTVDQDEPVITLTGGDTVYIEEKAAWVEPGYKAEDKTDGDLTSQVKVSGEVGDTPDWYQIIYSVTDKSSHSTTKIRDVRRKGVIVDGDKIAPVITLMNSKDTAVTVIKGAKFTVPTILRVEDNVDGAIPKDSVKVIGLENVNTNVVGSYSITLLATDKAGNPGRLIIKVLVVDGTVDNIPPVIKLKGKNPDTVSVSTSNTYKDSGATATDNIDKNLVVSVSGSVDRKTEGTYTLTYTVFDAAGLSDTATRTVVVKMVNFSNLLEKYQVPGAAALPSLNKSFMSVEIDGDATEAPNLTAMKEFKINWDKGQKSIYDMSMNFSSSINYVSLTGRVTHTLDKVGPTMTLTGVTQVPKLDGEYYAAMDGSNFVLVRTDGSFAMIMKP
jgi:hypothetical protein